MIRGIEKFDDVFALIDTDDNLFDEFNLKNIVVVVPCAVTDDGKFYPKNF